MIGYVQKACAVKRNNTKIKNVIFGIILVLIILIGGIKIYQYYNRNPFLLELQQIVAEESGGDFSVALNCSKKEKIYEVQIEATDAVYLKNDVFSKVDKLQKIVYEYVMQNQDDFFDIDLLDSENSDQYEEKRGLEVSFTNSEYPRSSGLSNIFCFYNKPEYKNENTKGFNSLRISELACRPESHYPNIKTSVLVNFADVNYLQCWSIVVDDLSFINKMKNLKEISVGEYDEEIKKAAKEAGIKCGNE